MGAGNAGLRLLSQFQFDVVKIDLSLVQRAGDDKTHSVLRSIVEIADRMGATTIAEGVETSGQLRTARRLSGSPPRQGYLLGRPGPDRDLSWVDIAALEQREDVAIPVRAGRRRPTGAAEPVRWDPQPGADEDRGGRAGERHPRQVGAAGRRISCASPLRPGPGVAPLGRAAAPGCGHTSPARAPRRSVRRTFSA